MVITYYIHILWAQYLTLAAWYLSYVVVVVVVVVVVAFSSLARIFGECSIIHPLPAFLLLFF